jgi:uncharacterized protein DUF5317
VLLVIGGVLGLVAGLATGGTLQNIMARRLRWPLVVVGAFLVKELELRSPLGAWGVGPPIFVASLVVLIAWLVWHRAELPGIWLVAAGTTMNLVATIANAGHMPVVGAAAYLGPAQLRLTGVWAEYALMGPATRLAWLGDWILLPGTAGRLFPQAYSPGDLVSLVGLTILLFLATRGRGAETVRGAITTR